VGTALFFLQTFRTNSAYSRWWDGRCLWDTLFMSSMSVARVIQAGGIQSQRLSRRALRWTWSFLVTLQAALRYEADISDLKPLLAPSEYTDLVSLPRNQRATLCLQRLTEVWMAAQNPKVINGPADKEFEKLMQDLVRTSGSMHRIMHTPMPLAYITHLRSFLFIWLGCLPFIFMPTLHYITIAACIVIAYALLGMEALILEIETPFGRDFNDLPSDNYIADAVKTLLKAYVTTQYLPATDGTDGDGPHGLQWEDRPGLAGAAAQHAAATAAGQAV